MFKIKIIAAACVLLLTGIVLSGAPDFSTSAKGDVFQEIARYKTWTQVNKKPIRVEIKLDDLSGGG